jgi:hypothetical protein
VAGRSLIAAIARRGFEAGLPAAALRSPQAEGTAEISETLRNILHAGLKKRKYSDESTRHEKTAGDH